MSVFTYLTNIYLPGRRQIGKQGGRLHRPRRKAVVGSIAVAMPASLGSNGSCSRWLVDWLVVVD